jgi:hypothetical protein|tara:strand:+ start:156 stop:461 length:306 start_codon:yes stop_codon:yes gene_type:complete
LESVRLPALKAVLADVKKKVEDEPEKYVGVLVHGGSDAKFLRCVRVVPSRINLHARRHFDIDSICTMRLCRHLLGDTPSGRSFPHALADISVAGDFLVRPA